MLVRSEERGIEEEGLLNPLVLKVGVKAVAKVVARDKKRITGSGTKRPMSLFFEMDTYETERPDILDHE